MSELPSSSNCDTMEKRVSPPKAIVDSSPLLINKNRESLKVKLLVRRSANQLVEQNILPPLKTSPAIHEQKKLLERAKTGDLLRAKIQQRPLREELERRHILEHHESHIDPSLADKRKMLEKALLVDQLNSKISHRPGPLELIEKNILHANEPIERIVKEGLLVPFNGNDSNFISFEDDSQSSESDNFQQKLASSTLSTNIISSNELPREPELKLRETKIEQHQTIFETTLPSSSQTGIILVPANTTFSTSAIPVTTIKIQNICGDKLEAPPLSNIPKPPPPPKLITYHVKPVIQTQVKSLISTPNLFPIQIEAAPSISNVNSILPSNSSTITNTQARVIQNLPISSHQQQKFAAPGKDKNRKKTKNKIVAKRTIKFHEYKGPSNKNSSNNSSSASSQQELGANKKLAESNYEVNMQQQCLLEYLDGIFKNPNSAKHKHENDSIKHTSKPLKIEHFQEEMDDISTSAYNKPHVTIFPSKPSMQTPMVQVVQQDIIKDSSIVSDVAKLSKMKVSELKTYLKKFNLPVSGPKPLLIERLKPYLPLKHLDEDETSVSSNVVSESNDVYCATLNSVSSNESEMDNMDGQFNQVSSSSKEDDIVFEQQRKIEELQIQLQQSQMELEMMKQNNVDNVFHSTSSTSIPSLIKIEVENEESANIENVVTQINQLPETSSVLQVNSEVLVEKNENLPTNADQKSINEIDLMKETGETNECSLTPLPTSQDLTEIFEILLKNGEWPDIHDIKEGEEFNQFVSGNDQKSDQFPQKYTENPDSTSLNNAFDASPMMQDDAIDKMLDNVISLPTLQENFSNGFEAHTSFPMEIDDAPMMMSNSDFNSNFNSALTSFDFNDLKTCDNRLVLDRNSENEQHFSSKANETHKPDLSVVTKSKNGLIGNFDQNFFDTLKNNNINNNLNHLANTNDMFLLTNDSKLHKDEKQHLSNNLNHSHNFELFTGIPMDFESIIPYNDLQTPDSIFGTFNSNSLLNEENMMMTCEDSNLLCNL